MAGTNEDILTLQQAGIETTRGTGVAATRKLYGQLTPSLTRTLVFYNSQTGTYEQRRAPAYGRTKPTFSYVEECTYEDLPWWAQFFMKGGVTGATDGNATPAYLYTFVPSTATDDLKSMSLEFNESGNPYESDQVMALTVTLRMDSDNDQEPAWMMDVSLIGRDWEVTTYTGSIADRTRECINARGTQLFIDDAGGTIGTTQKTGSLISCSITWNLATNFKAFAEDTKYVSANKVGRGPRLVDGQFTFEFDNDVEFAKYRNTDAQQRLISLKSTGSVVHAGSPAPTASKYMQIFLPGYWSSWSRGTRVNNLTATFGLMASYDTTLTYASKLVVNNALATLP